jgi:phage terminase large subunit GpA-like protein
MTQAVLQHPTAADCLATFWQAAQPRRSLPVSEWADTHRVLSGKQAGERGPYRTSRTPFLREIMDCFSHNSRVTDLVVMKSSQVGVTEATVNVIGYVMDHAPGPMMVMLPTLESRDKWKTQKLNPLFTDTPVIRDLLGGNRSRDAANRQDMIDFPGGVLFLAGGNSPNSYSQSSVRIIVLDDFDRFPAEVGDEGDVEGLADGRTKAFRRAIRCKISTPVLKDGLIHRSYEASDQRKYHVPCPHCGEFQPLEWGGPDKSYGIKWNEAVTEAWYLCRECHALIFDHHKPEMLRKGRWIAAHPEADVRGYHISALYAPIGLGPTWLELAKEWKEAQSDTGKLQVFTNTELGEPWEQKRDGADSTTLLTRLEDYPEDLLVYARAAGVDVQKDRLELTLYDFSHGEESWAVDHIIIEGDTAFEDVWDELDEILKAFSPDAVGIDTGYNTDQAMAFCEGKKWCWPMKGIEGKGKPLTEDDQARKRRLRHRRKKGFSPHIISDRAAMALLLARLKLEKPGPGYIHFPKSGAFDDEFFEQLTSNKLEEKKSRGKRVVEWVQTRPRNEAYDCWKMALAALRLAKIDMSGRQPRPRTIEHNNDPAYGPGQAARQIKAVATNRPVARGGGGIGNDDWSKRL